MPKKRRIGEYRIMSKKDTSVHINMGLLEQVLKGEADSRKSIGVIRHDGEIVRSLYVHFTKDSGAARVSDKGLMRFNARPLATKEQRATRALSGVLQSTAKTATTAPAPEVTDEDVDAFVDSLADA